MEVLANPSVRAALGGSVIAEELRGDFTEARRVAAAAGALEVCLVDAISGRAGAARRRLAEVRAPDDTHRRVTSLLAWFADMMHFRNGPMNVGARREDLEGRWDSASGLREEVGALQQDAELQLAGPRTASELELLLKYGLEVGWRRTVASCGLRGNRIPEDFFSTPSFTLGSNVAPAAATIADFAALVRAGSANLVHDPSGASRSPCSVAWTMLAGADLIRRSGETSTALEAIRIVRRGCEDARDLHGAALCWLAEGDARACVVESPATLGLSLETTGLFDHGRDHRIEERERARVSDAELAAARAAFAEAQQCFAAAGAPRGLAAVELRLAGVAALAGDHAEAREHASAAESTFATTGDDCHKQLARIHGVLADTARRIAIDPDRVREVGAWGASDGNLCCALGLGQMLACMARRWLFWDADYEQAVRCARLAEELFAAAGAPLAASQALRDQFTAHKTIGDRGAAIAVAQRADQLLASVPVSPERQPAIAVRRQMFALDAWSQAVAAADPDAMEHLAARLARGATDLGTDFASQLLAEQVRSSVRITAVMAPQYRAAELELDPEVSDERRAEAWQAAAAAVANSPEPDRWLHMGYLQAMRRDRAGAAEISARYFAIEPTLPISGSSPSDVIELLREAQVNHTYEAFTMFVGLGDPVRARPHLAKLIALDGEDWWKRQSSSWEALACHGDLLRHEGAPAAAVAIYEHARDLLEVERAKLRDDSSRTAFADLRPAQRLFARGALAALTMTPPDPARAFDFLERGRARALANLVRDVRATTAGSDPIARWREACARRDLAEALISREQAASQPDGEQLAALQHQLADRERQIADLEAEARAHSPERFRALDARGSVAPLGEVVKHIPDGVVVIELSVVDDLLLGWALTCHGMTATLHRELDDRVLRRDVREFRRACAHPGHSLAAGHRLAAVLLSPFADAIRAASQVVFVVAGELSLMPLHALPFDGDALIAHVAVSYAPSVSLLGALATQPVAGKPILVVGDPPNMSLVRPEGVQQLPALPGARLEAEAIGALVPGSRVLIADATTAAVTAALPQFRVVHLATHGLVDDRSPWLSAIMLARGDQLTLSELMGLALSADLVVLSACDSGTGELTRGEELLGLARGLLAAGARAALVSLWSVYDQPTRLLMVELHRQLQAGARPADALRAAQLHVRRLDPATVDAEAAARGHTAEHASARRKITFAAEPPQPAGIYAHPVCWAPFVLVGV